MIGAVFLVLAFIVLLRRFALVEKSSEVLTITRRSLAVIRNAELSDERKENALQDNAKQMLRLSFVLTAGGAAAVLLPVGLLWVCDRLGWLSLAVVFSTAVSPGFLIGSGLVALLAILLPASKEGSRKTDYSALDRVVHRVAFRTYGVQTSIADIEDRLFARPLGVCQVDRPVFITALPRAGTTLLLECCAKLPDFASHCYRDMPFVLVPCLWSRFSAKFQLSGELRERAHGDGMLIDFDSPEALEEVVWKTFWPRHYRNNRITPWRNQEHTEFEEFLRRHICKIILLRRGAKASTARYVSKNNLNIARATWLHRHFPKSTIVVPVRAPLQHAASLLSVHVNLCRIQAEDSFASEYMRAIGHFDFGEDVRPIDFDSWFETRKSVDTQELAFWLEYWVASYRHLLQNDSGWVHFLDYDGLCERPEQGLRALADLTETRHPDKLLSAATTIHPGSTREVDMSVVPRSLLAEANYVYDELRRIAVNRS